MSVIIFTVLSFIALVQAQKLVLYDATKLSNVYGREISMDGTMNQWTIRSPGNLAFVPRQDSYLYTTFACQDLSAYNTLEISMTGPLDSNFNIELQNGNGECNKRTNGYTQNVKSAKTISIPFRSFNGFNSNRVWAISMHGFSARNQEHVIHSISVTKTTLPKISGNGMYCAYKTGDKYYKGLCVASHVSNNTQVDHNLCNQVNVISPAADTEMFYQWQVACSGLVLKESYQGVLDFRMVTPRYYEAASKDGAVYAPQNPQGNKYISKTTFANKATTIVTTNYEKITAPITMSATTASLSMYTLYNVTTTKTYDTVKPTVIEIPVTRTSTITLPGNKTQIVTYVNLEQVSTEWTDRQIKTEIYDATMTETFNISYPVTTTTVMVFTEPTTYTFYNVTTGYDTATDI